MTVQTMRAALGLAVVAGLALLAMPGSAQEVANGPVSGLPLPRYVSLKSDRVNLREGPSKEHRTSWVFQRAGLPVEITAEFETWRRVRDADGTEGWVLHSLLSGRRTVLVSPWSKNKGESFSLRETTSESAPVVATLEPGVIANVQSCQNAWCRVTVSKMSGYIKQDRLWGVYPNETVQ